jgi:hypothetical protein
MKRGALLVYDLQLDFEAELSRISFEMLLCPWWKILGAGFPSRTLVKLLPFQAQAR